MRGHETKIRRSKESDCFVSRVFVCVCLLLQKLKEEGKNTAN